MLVGKEGEDEEECRRASIIGSSSSASAASQYPKEEEEYGRASIRPWCQVKGKGDPRRGGNECTVYDENEKYVLG